METVNITLKLKPSEVFEVQDYIKEYYELISLKIAPNTSKMYEEDKHFKKLVKAVKEAQKQRDIYINDNLNKFK
jgi:hypothetical protein